MKKLIASLFLVLGIALITAPVPAQFSGCNPGLCSASDRVSSTPVSNACINSSGTTITFTAQGTGSVNAGRISVVSINWSDSTVANTAELTGMTIGGINMIRAVRAAGDNQSSNSEIWYAANPTGTTANIVATFSTAVDGITIETYSLIGYQSVTNITTGTTSVSQAYSNKQLAISAGSRRVNVSTSLSNMTNDFSSACGAFLWGVHASAPLHGNNGTLTSAISPTSNTPLIALAVWSTVFTPVPGVLAWWDASVFSSMNLTGSTVNSIADQSGNGNTLTANGSISKPTYSATGFNTSYPTLQFNATANRQSLARSNFQMGTGRTLTVWVVGTLNSSSDSSGRFFSYTKPGATHDYDNVGSWLFSRSSVNQLVFIFCNLTFVEQNITYGAPSRYIATIDSNGAGIVYVNGSPTPLSSITWPNFVNAGVLAIGNGSTVGDAATGLNGTMSEFGFSSAYTDPTGVAALDTRLKNKWGL